MNYEEKIKELEDRVNRLEIIEKKRKNKKTVKIVLKLFLTVTVIIMLIMLYKFVKPYFNDIKNISGIEEKLKDGESYFKEQIDTLKNN